MVLMAAPAAHAVDAGTGIRGTLDLRWGGITGAPVTGWDGRTRLVFDPSAAAREATLRAIGDPALGEPTRAVYAPQVQAARVTALEFTRTDAVLCPADDGGTYAATESSSAGGIADGRVAFEILPPVLDLLAGRGTIALDPHVAPSASGWWLADRLTLPGRHSPTGASPCPGTGAPARLLPRILAVNGGAAVPRVISDWISDDSRSLAWPVRRTGGGWRVVIGHRDRPVFSESVFGPQDTQRMDVEITSDLYLAGTPARLGARCRIPTGRMNAARTPAEAVRWARRAGLNARFAGTRRVPWPRGARYEITGPQIGMGAGLCGRGTYRVWRYAAR
jgi:hypothetical protein